MTLLFLRHGQTDWNLQGLFQGQTDVPLNETGRAQARESAAALKSHQPPAEIIYSSPLLRAKETAEFAKQALDVPIYFDDRQIERSFGALEGTSIERIFGNSPIRHRQDEEKLAPYGAEPYADLEKRVRGFLDDMAAKHPEQCVLVASHGVVGRMVQHLCHFEETTRIENGTVMQFTY